MGRILRLPPELANQIAAGEVVERPGSVVKELVENALDAGARRISIAIEQGGKQLVRVEDDGTGMDAEDAALALERHATSKISRAEHLGAIRTFGFRGEALPSIASVSHLVLRTRSREAAAGTEVRVNGGIVAGVVAVGMAPGTIVEVADLFYNLPARRKFLKVDGAESAQVSRTVGLLALAYPETGFTLTSGPRMLLRCAPAHGLADRFYQLFGDRPDLVPLHKDAAGMLVYGYVAALAEQGPTRGAQDIFVNRRIVKDRTIAHAIIDAYAMASMKERSPEVHLFLDMAADAVDVNVHPTKAEVRFRNQSLVHEVVRRALQDALGGGPPPELRLRPPDAVAAQPVPVGIPGVLSGTMVPVTGPQLQGQEEFPPARNAADIPPDSLTSEVAIKPLVPLGQFRDTFIIAIDTDGIAIIDQHVAHERVLFERVLQRLTNGTLESQGLLEPLLLDLTAGGRHAVLTHVEELGRFGFAVEEFGGDSVRVSAVPALLTRAESEGALRALAADLEGLDHTARVQDVLRRIAATTACHAAVKANQALTLEKMRHIMEELRQTAYSTVCPHGRPVMLRLTRREVERNFQRI